MSASEIYYANALLGLKELKAKYLAFKECMAVGRNNKQRMHEIYVEMIQHGCSHKNLTKKNGVECRSMQCGNASHATRRYQSAGIREFSATDAGTRT